MLYTDTPNNNTVYSIPMNIVLMKVYEYRDWRTAVCLTEREIYCSQEIQPFTTGPANNESSEVVDILLPIGSNNFILTLQPGLIMSKTSDDFLFATWTTHLIYNEPWAAIR